MKMNDFDLTTEAQSHREESTVIVCVVTGFARHQHTLIFPLLRSLD